MSILRSGARGWLRLRYQLLSGIFVAVVIPYLIRRFLFPGGSVEMLNVTALASILAIVLGGWLAREVSAYPGAEASAYILPAFPASFGIAAFILLSGRIDYARSVLISGFLISIIWFYFLQIRFQARRQLLLGLVPFGAVSSIKTLPGISLRLFTHPDDDFSGVQAIVADLRHDFSDDWDRRLADYALAGVPVYHCKQLVESITGRVELEHLSENSFGTLTPASSYMAFKHFFDWFLALAVLAVIWPLFLLVALAIRLDSPGPSLFRQERVGYCGDSFTVIKFRTMHVRGNGVEDRAAAMTQSSDARITRLGQFLRRSRIDELPQIINVLRGEMSWIGPRPEAKVLSAWYTTDIPFYRYRHIVRPGITGWAQVNQGHVSDVEDVAAKLQYDLFYIKNFSPWIDLLIVARTIKTMLTGFGAR